MAKIGIYDSGVGGLTTLARLMREFEHCDFWFFADNSNFPLGTRSESDLINIAAERVRCMSTKCDFLVLACNTASSHTSDDAVIKLLPPLDNLEPESTLVLATPSTVSRLKLKDKGFITLDTPELAGGITDAFFVKREKRAQRLKQIEDGLCQKLVKYPVPKTVVIGCSHYVFIDDIIRNCCPNAVILDGNNNIIQTLKKYIKPARRTGAVFFEFSGEDHFSAYISILEELLCKN